MTVKVAVPVEINDSILTSSDIPEPDASVGEVAWDDEDSRSITYTLSTTLGKAIRYNMTRNNYGELLIVFFRDLPDIWGVAKFDADNNLVWEQEFDTDTGISGGSLESIGCGIEGDIMILYWMADLPSSDPDHQRIYEQRISNIAGEGAFPLSYTSSAVELASVPQTIKDSTHIRFCRSGGLIFSCYSSNSSGFLEEVKISRLSLDGSEQDAKGTGTSTGNVRAITADFNGGAYVSIDGDYSDGKLNIQHYTADLTKESEGKVAYDSGNISLLAFYEGVIYAGVRPASGGLNKIDVTPYSQTYTNLGAYKKDDEVVYLPNHTKYVCLADETFSNPSETATGDANAEWLKIGLSNKWAMFDESVSYSSLISANTSVAITPSSEYNAVGCVGISGIDSVTIEILDQSDSTLYTETKSAANPDPEFSEFKISEILFTDIPPFIDTKVKVTFSVDSSGSGKIGDLIVGKSYNLGKAVLGTQSNTKDFSEQKEDKFGNFEYIERAIVPSVTYQIDVKKNKAIAVQRFVNSLRGKSNLWYADIGESEFLTVYGRCETIPMTYENHSIVSYKAKVRGTI